MWRGAPHVGATINMVKQTSEEQTRTRLSSCSEPSAARPRDAGAPGDESSEWRFSSWSAKPSRPPLSPIEDDGATGPKLATAPTQRQAHAQCRRLDDFLTRSRVGLTTS